MLPAVCGKTKQEKKKQVLAPTTSKFKIPRAATATPFLRSAIPLRGFRFPLLSATSAAGSGRARRRGARAGPGCLRSCRRFLGRARTPQPWEDGSRRDRGGGRASSRAGQPPASGEGRAPTNIARRLPENLRPPPTELPVRRGGGAASLHPPGRAL